MTQVEEPYDDMFLPSPGTLVVLGNGFDLDLGFRTSYKDFCGSNNQLPFDEGGFPFPKGAYRDNYHDLGEFIRTANQIDKWYDLENLLSEYGDKRKMVFPNDDEVLGRERKYDRKDYDSLVESFGKYLRSLDYSHPNKDSVAAKVFQAAYSSIEQPLVYTFNYTDIEAIGSSLGINNKIYASYVHGSLKRRNIILGVGDYSSLPRSLSFMYKTDNVSYRKTRLMEDLQKCSTLVIFGLSLSPVDYPYFQDMFASLAGGSARKYIRIITYDDSSREDILYNLRGMNRGMIKLMNYSDIDVIRTKGNVDEVKVQELIQHLTLQHEYNI